MFALFVGWLAIGIVQYLPVFYVTTAYTSKALKNLIKYSVACQRSVQSPDGLSVFFSRLFTRSSSILRNAGILQALHFVVDTWLGSRDEQAEGAVNSCILRSRTVRRSSPSFQVQVVSGQFGLKNEDTRRLNYRRGRCFRFMAEHWAGGIST